MAMFTVTSIIDGDTFDVSPQWKWNGQSGNHIRPAGYDAPDLHAYWGQAAKAKLSRLIHGDRVELQSARKVDWGRLVCEAFFKDTNLASYFPEYQ